MATALVSEVMKVYANSITVSI